MPTLRIPRDVIHMRVRNMRTSVRNVDVATISCNATVRASICPATVRTRGNVEQVRLVRTGEVMKPRKTAVMLVAGMALAASIELGSVGVAGATSNTTNPTPPKTHTVPKPKTVKPSSRKHGVHTKRHRSPHRRPVTTRQHRLPTHRRPARVHSKRR